MRYHYGKVCFVGDIGKNDDNNNFESSSWSKTFNQFHHHNNNDTNMIMKCECEKGNPSCLFQRLLLQKVW